MIFYRTGIYLYFIAIVIASLFNSKAKEWLKGRRLQKNDLKNKLPRAKRIWFHFASLGEFEQGRVLLENIQLQYPHYKFVISFFSPSGYLIRKNYALAEKVYYLPLDSAANAKLFLDHINPDLIFFNKYEYWFHYIQEAKNRNIPLFVSSVIFRKEQVYFKWYGSFQRNILRLVNYFFLQNSKSQHLLQSININNADVCGDTRFDRVYEHSLNPKNDEVIAAFCAGQKIFVAGSTWPKDESILLELKPKLNGFKMILVPHEISDSHINQLSKLCGDDAILYTDCINKEVPKNKSILIVNTIGLLNSIYKQASYCYIGGGFGAGIHNTLEAAVYGKPIFFGPKYQKFEEAKDLINAKAAFSIQHVDELNSIIQQMETSHELYNTTCDISKKYVMNNKGATEKILNFLKVNNFLT
jgi:3-deoxy-D-manno-octulosonic-acid transferase